MIKPSVEALLQSLGIIYGTHTLAFWPSGSENVSFAFALWHGCPRGCRNMFNRFTDKDLTPSPPHCLSLKQSVFLGINRSVCPSLQDTSTSCLRTVRQCKTKRKFCAHMTWTSCVKHTHTAPSMLLVQHVLGFEANGLVTEAAWGPMRQKPHLPTSLSSSKFIFF